MDPRISGANELQALSAKLKRLARGDLRREMLASIRKAAAPLAEAAQKSAAENLPKSGGLAADVASSRVVVRTRATGSSARVRLQETSRHNTRSMDKGRIYHPTFGHDPKVVQRITPGFFSKPMEEGSPHVREAIVRVLDDINRKL